VDANAMVIASRQSASLAVQRQQHVMHVSSPQVDVDQTCLAPSSLCSASGW